MGALIGHHGLLLSSVPGITYRSRLQFSGADGSTTFTDDTGKTWTTFGDAQIDTSLGDQRGLFDGTGDYIRTPSHPDIVFGTGAFKITFTQRYTSKSGFQTIASKGYLDDVAKKWLLQTGDGDGRLNWYWKATATGADLVCGETTGTINTGQDYLIEIERAGGTLTIKRDGVTVASGADTNDYTNTADLYVGSGGSVNPAQYPFNGSLKDWQVT